MLQKAAVNAHGELEHFRRNVETAFDDSMQRASGWYKRKAQLVLGVLAAIFAIGLNVNSVQVAKHLYNDEAVRTAVVSQVQADAAGEAQRSDESAQPGQAANVAADAVSQVEQLQLPVGWSAENRPSGFGGWVGALAGWLITIAALNLGAPFWFDLLSRLSRQRGAGIPEKPNRVLSDNPKPEDVEEPPAVPAGGPPAKPAGA